jgi:hypothetical protein
MTPRLEPLPANLHIIIDSAPIPERGKSKKLADGKGLHLLIRNDGRRYWRLKFRLFGKEQTYSIGMYPDVGLEVARKATRSATRSPAYAIGRSGSPGARL